MKNGIIILVGPSGVGKSTLLTRLVQDFSQLRDLITYTTRSMRPGEKEGDPYFFVSHDKFLKLIEQNFFIEWAEVHGNLYGTPVDQLKATWDEGKVVIMDVDTQGAKTFMKKYPQSTTIFVLPPSIDELRQRLAMRDAGKTKDLELRMKNAEKELGQVEDFDYQLVNDRLESSYAKLQKMIEDLLRNR